MLSQPLLRVILGGTVGGVACPSGKGKRLIILHAGSEDGWVPNRSLVYQSLNDDGDYHQEMNHIIFEKWFETQLLPNIPPNSLSWIMLHIILGGKRYCPQATGAREI